MSMYRQLWLAIITSTMLALLGSLLAATLSARSYLSEQLSMKDADNASALAFSLSQQKADIVEIELAVSAMFDSGHYESIRVFDPFGKSIVERHSDTGDLGVPAWFSQLLPIVAVPGTAQITNGWQQTGSVELVSHSRFAYLSLWKSVLEMIVALAVSGLVGGLLGSWILGRLRQPLALVVTQAQAITERRFVTIDEPKVPELKQLAVAMNATVIRLKTMFEEEAGRLDAVRKEANCDPLTGLANRNYFMARLREALDGEDATGGGIMLIRIAYLADINHRLGRNVTDELVRRFAATIGQAASGYRDGLAARLNGADFAFLLPGNTGPRQIAETLLQRIIMETESFVDHAPIVQIGIGHFPPGLDASTILGQVDAALASAENLGDNSIAEARLVEEEELPRSGADWARLIGQAIDKKWVRLISFPVTDLAGRLIHRECPLRLMLDEHGDWLPAGRFLPMAERLRLTPRIDLAAVSLGLDRLATDVSIPGLAINLSANSIQDDGFRQQLLELLSLHADVAGRLWLEVAETGVINHYEAFRSIVGSLKGTGCRVGIEHFGRHFSQIGMIHDLGLDYLKVDASFIRSLDKGGGNRTFLQGLSIIAHGIGLTVIAEGVASRAELQALAEVGFDGATGPAVKETGQ